MIRDNRPRYIQSEPSFKSQIGTNIGQTIGQMFGQALAPREQQQQEISPGIATATNALQTIKGLVGQSGIGLSGLLNLSPEARRNRGLFKTSTSALLPIFKELFPRGFTEKEFKQITEKYLPSEYDTEEAIIGKLQGLEDMIVGRMPQELLRKQEMPKEVSRQSQKIRWDPSNRYHKMRAQEVLQSVGGDQAKARAILDQEFMQ